MLLSLTIQHFALIERLTLDWQKGMTVLTGETGAGKSILIDALGLSLGDRADSGVIREGAEQADISATFRLGKKSEAKIWLTEQAIECEDEVILRRVINKDGRSRAFINGSPATLTQLRDLGALLVEIHGQHEHQRLLLPNHQRDIVDLFGQHEELVEQVRQAFRQWQKLKNEWHSLQGDEGDRSARVDLLRFQTTELRNAGVENCLVSELESRHTRAAHGAEMRVLAEQIGLALDDDENGASARLAFALEKMQRLTHLDPSLSATQSSLIDLQATLFDLAHDMHAYAERIDIDEENLAELERQITLLHSLARKHRVDMAALPEHLHSLQEQLDALDNSSERVQALEKALEAAQKHWQSVADKLSAARQKTAKKLAEAVQDYMAKLGMKGGKFVVELTARADHTPFADGNEKMDFLVSANAGQSVKPLAKVASGGELSRISLAIQVLVSLGSDTPCMVFDEVDVGVGGATAETVGRLLRKLAKSAQVLCVTHQPQVASLGHQHYKVSKASKAKVTSTAIEVLSDDARVDEIARMVGGVTITDTTRQHAKEMLNLAEG